jgi:aminopeptidase N
VAGTNITEAEAATRAAHLRVEGYDVSLDLRNGDTFRTETTVRFAWTAPGVSTWLDLIAPEVESITLNGTSLDPASHYVENRIQLPGLVANNVATVVASGLYMKTGEGVHRFVDPVDDETYIYTQFESSDARRAFACFEQPDLKSTFRFEVTAPEYWRVISNSPTPEPKNLGDGRSVWKFPATPKLSTYVCAIVAGPYHEVRDEYVGPFGTYPMGIYCRRSLAQYLDAEDVFLISKQGMAYFEEKFGLPYPFEKYDQSFVPEFNAGAMENAGCVTHHESYLFRSRVTDLAYEQRSNTILHELAHMWFGDLVTMRWWDDIWLNESFAEWASHDAMVNATRYKDAWTPFLVLRKAWAYRQDQLASTHPIYSEMPGTDTIAANFDGITYAKGAATLRQLVAWVGEEAFTAGLRNYFVKHAWGNTVLKDLLDELEVASGRALKSWSEAWLTTAGANLLRPFVESDEHGMITRLAVVQEPPSAPPGLPPILRPHRIAIGCYNHEGEALVRTRRVEVDVAGPLTQVPELVGTPRPALLLLNDDDLTYAKVRLDMESLETAIRALPALRAPMPRALIWAAAWDMTRDAEMSAGQFLQLVSAGLPDESDVSIAQQLISQSRLTIDGFAAPHNRDDYIARFAATLRDLLRDGEPGSDLQHVYLRGYAGIATDATDLKYLAALRSGTQVLPGLAIDTELRWNLLLRLVITGNASDADIAEELRRDDTAAGARYAMQANAARPTGEAKAAAWEAAVTGNQLTNSLLAATVGGFAQRDQLDLLLPYREKYFREVPAAYKGRTHEMASTIGAGLFPHSLVDQRTVEMADESLARTDLPDSLRRAIVEGRDAVERALRARTYDSK